MDLRRLLVPVCLGWLLLSQAQTARAFCRLTTEMPIGGGCTSGTPLWWKRECITFSVVKRSDTSPSLRKIRDAASLSFQTWTDVVCNNEPVSLNIAQTAQLVGCEDPEYNRHAGNANTVIFVEDWAERELPVDAFGLTLVWHDMDSGEIFDADMQINETIGPIDVCGSTCPPGVVDLQNVMTHEAGHFLGLGHSPVTSATMSSRASIGETSKRTLHNDDRAGICTIFGKGEPNCAHDDFAPAYGFSRVCAPPEMRQACSVGVPGAPHGSTAAGGLLLLGSAALVRRRFGRTRAACTRG